MKIHNNPVRHSPLRNWLENLSSNPKQLWVIAFCLCMAAAIGTGTWAIYKYKNDIGFYKATKAISAGHGARGALVAIANSPTRYARALMASNELDTLQIDIKFRNWQHILRARDRALGVGMLVTEEGDEVSARMFFQGRKIPIKMRLKGDWLDHLNGTTGWSFRVKVRNSDQVYGMRRFSIQHPRTRGYYSEPLYLKHLRSEGIVAPRYTFAKVVVNGTDWGMMAIEEHFSKELLESQQRKEGMLGRFDESLLWEQKATGTPYRHLDNFQTSTFKPFSRARLERNPIMKSQTAIAEGLIAAFQANRIAAEDVFDLQRFARFIVISEAWNGWHAMRWANQRFYFNPYTLKFEPVAYDNGNIVASHERSVFAGGLPGDPNGDIVPKLLRDKAMQAALAVEVKRLSELVTEDYLTELLEDDMQQALRAIPLSNPFVPPPQLEIVRNNLNAMQQSGAEYFAIPNSEPWQSTETIRDSDFASSLQYVATRLYSSGQLEIVNRLPVAVELRELRFQPHARENGTAVPIMVQSLAEVIPASLDLNKLQSTRITLPREYLPEHGRLTLATSIPGQDIVRSSPIGQAIAEFDKHPLSARESATALAANHDWLHWNKEKKQLEAIPGQWNVDSSIVIPAGVSLDIPAGVHLRFAADVAIRMSAALNLRGSSDRPVILESQHPETPWRGIYINGANEPSTWQHVIVRNTNAYERDGLVLTGAVTFRVAPVELHHVEFDGTVAEDALNIVEAEFLLNDITVRSTRSDGFDCDFCTGRVTDSYFADIGGDAFDVSGSQVTVENTRFERIRDKAVSAGEKSNVSVKNLQIYATGSAIVSKDASHVLAENSTVDNIGVAALMAYIKKPEFGPASMQANDIRIINARTETIVQSGSAMKRDGVDLEPIEIDIEAMYKTGAMKK